MQPQTNKGREDSNEKPTEEQMASQTIRELDYNISDNQGIKIPVSYFSAKNKTKPETLLYNITRLINTNDTADIDFTPGGTNNKELKPLCSRFCDNIIVYFIISEDIIKQSKTLTNYINCKETNEPTEKNTTEEDKEEKDKEEKDKEEKQLNRVLKEISPFLAINTEHIKDQFYNLDVSINKTHIKPASFKVDKGTIKQYVKISLPDIPLNKVLDFVCKQNVIKEFNDNGIFINDTDITQDYSGTINNNNVIDFLLTKPDFRREGEEAINEDTTEEVKTIIDNNESVGGNCLTFITNSTNGAVRYKFYNKFVQSMESPSVRGRVGNHYSHWINNSEQILKESINKAL